jgi:hypothetical protein
LERARHLDVLLSDPAIDAPRLAEAFLTPPLFSNSYADGFGTVYTACYRPESGAMSLMWPGQEPRHWSFTEFPETSTQVAYAA